MERRETRTQQERFQHGKYELGMYLSHGACGTVVMCHKMGKPSKKYVCKYMDTSLLSRKLKEGSEREAKLLQQFDHRNIVKLIDVFECDAKLHIIMEFCPGGDLRSKIQETIHNDDIFTYKQIRVWMIELCDALKTIHAAKIVHRDIKPENVFLVNDQYLKIGDLGISRKSSAMSRPTHVSARRVTWHPKCTRATRTVFPPTFGVWALC